jgi:hypothetical protein
MRSYWQLSGWGCDTCVKPDVEARLTRLSPLPDVLTLKTLADVRTLVERHLPAEYRSKFTWRPFAGLLIRATLT